MANTPTPRPLGPANGPWLTAGVGTLLGIAALGAYAFTPHPSVPGGDSWELIAVAYTSGTAHPPGYPLYTLLARLFTLIPFGTVAWRVNALSAVLDASAAVVLFVAVTRWTRTVWAGLLAGGLFAFAPVIWSYAVVAEVFALNNLFVAILLWLGVRFHERRDAATASWAVLVLGLAASNHHTIVLFGIPFGLWLFSTGPASLGRPAGIARLAGLFGLGLLPYAYLPLAGARLPLISWGDFSSFDGFLDHFLRRDYGTFQLAAGTARHGQLGTGLIGYLSGLPTQLLYVGPALAAVGLLATIRREGASGVAVMTGVSVVLYLTVFGSLANLELDNALLLGVFTRFWQQPTVWVCAWIGLGFAVVASFLQRPPWSRWGRPAAALAVILAVGLQFGLHVDEQDEHDNTVIADYGRAILKSLPPDALLVSLGDLDTNALRYLQLCEQVRPDVRVID